MTIFEGGFAVDVATGAARIIIPLASILVLVLGVEELGGSTRESETHSLPDRRDHRNRTAARSLHPVWDRRKHLVFRPAVDTRRRPACGGPRRDCRGRGRAVVQGGRGSRPLLGARRDAGIGNSGRGVPYVDSQGRRTHRRLSFLRTAARRVRVSRCRVAPTRRHPRHGEHGTRQPRGFLAEGREAASGLVGRR